MAYKKQMSHAEIDPDVKMPAAIRAAALRADAMHNTAYTPAPAPAPDKEPEKAPEVEEKEKAPEPVKVENEPAKPASETSDWEHKYNSLKGRYDRQETTMQGLNSRIMQLESLLANAQSARTVQQPTPDLTFKNVSAEEREAYGEEFLDVSARAAAERINPQIANLQREIANLKGTLGNVAEQNQKSVKERMYSHLDESLPNWREINRDQKFLAWCNLPDAFSGAIRISLMRDAFDKGDSQRVLRFFNGFLSDEAVTAPGAKQPEMPNGKVPLEKFAAPGRAKAPAASTPPGEKETISRAQIASFYANVQKGKYRGNEAEKDRLETEIFLAEQEGRVTN